MDQINNFTCHCKAGFTGPKCEEDINECLQLTCGNGKYPFRVNDSVHAQSKHDQKEMA